MVTRWHTICPHLWSIWILVMWNPRPRRFRDGMEAFEAEPGVRISRFPMFFSVCFLTAFENTQLCRDFINLTRILTSWFWTLSKLGFPTLLLCAHMDVKLYSSRGMQETDIQSLAIFHSFVDLCLAALRRDKTTSQPAVPDVCQSDRFRSVFPVLMRRLCNSSCSLSTGLRS